MRSYIAAVTVTAVLLGGCSLDSAIGVADPYRIDIRQGNYVDQDMLAQLRKGMSREQVRFVLGSPLVADVFRNDRWDYVYHHRSGRAAPQQRVISVFFVNDVLDRVEGDVQAADATGEGAQPSTRVRVVEVPGPARRD